MISLTRFIRYSVSLNYVNYEYNRGRNMVIHHGLMGSSKNFNSISKNSSVSKYVNSYLIDCRNHGISPHTQTHSIQNLADDLYQFIQQHKLLENKKLTLMGHSMGAMALMKFTEKYSNIQESIDRVILIDMSCYNPESDPSINSTGKMLSRMAKINLNQPTVQLFHQIQNQATGKDVAGLLKLNIKIVGQNKHQWIPNLNTIVKQYHHLNKFNLQKNQWTKPVEVIYGQKSNYVNEAQITKYCQLYSQMSRQNNFHKITGAGHWVHFQNTRQFLRTIQIILKRDE